jgi:uncharacterized membrane-anchored protein YhcB (DUF1043 family)
LWVLIRKSHKTILSLLASCFLPVMLLAQTLPDLKFRHLNITNGLPSDKIFFSYKDSKNLLWIATSNGLIRYDGLHYKLYVERKGNNTGFYGKSIGKIIEDSLGNLYIGNERGINYYERRKERFTHLFYKQDGDGKEFITPQYIDNNNKLWFFSSGANRLVSYDSKTKEFREKQADCAARLITYPTAFYNRLQLIVSVNLTDGVRVFTCHNGEPTSHKDYFSKGNDRYPEAIIKHKLYVQDAQNIWLPSNLGLIWLNPFNEKFTLFQTYGKKEVGSVTCVSPLDERYLLVGTAGNGVLVFDRLSREFVKNIRHIDSDPASPSSNQIDDILCDIEKNIFITNYGKGVDIASWPGPAVLHSFSRQSTALFGTTNNLRFMHRVADSLFWCANEENKILQWNRLNNGVSEPEYLKEFNRRNKGRIIRQIYNDNDRKTWIVTDDALYYKSMSNDHLYTIPVEASAKRIAMLDTGRYLFTTHRSLFLLTYAAQGWSVREITELAKEKLSAHSTILTDVAGGSIYILSEWGQVISQLKPFSDRFRLVKKSTWSYTPCGESYFYSDSRFILLPGAGGLLQLDKNDFSFKKRCEGQVADNELASLIKYNDSTLFVLSVNSLLKITLPDWISSTENLPLPDAIKKNLLYKSLYSDNELIYLATNDGIIQYNPLQKNNGHIEPEIYFSSIVTDDKNDTLFPAPQYNEEITVSAATTRLDIFLSNLNFADGNSLHDIQYQLVNYQASPQPVDANGALHINKPAPGEYFLKIIHRDDAKLLKQLKIVFKPRWYQTTWFKTALTLLVICMGFWIYRMRIGQIRKQAKLKSDYENKMIHLEMQNLRSQMNPHFIFNSLNSINSFIVENKTHLASDYLTKFSRLIRLILEHSKNESISLEKELETLRLYFLMESLRFDKKFDYFVYVEPDLDTQLIKIPPMIIQPYAENAIWHGLLHKTGKRKVEVRIKRFRYGNGQLSASESLLIEIEDNGVGRSRAAALKSKNSTSSKSYGMQITGQRIIQLNKENKIAVIDLQDDNGNAIGTKVDILICYQ